jgi:hypothetical protein
LAEDASLERTGFGGAEFGGTMETPGVELLAGLLLVDGLGFVLRVEEDEAESDGREELLLEEALESVFRFESLGEKSARNPSCRWRRRSANPGSGRRELASMGFGSIARNSPRRCWRAASLVAHERRQCPAGRLQSSKLNISYQRLRKHH